MPKSLHSRNEDWHSWREPLARRIALVADALIDCAAAEEFLGRVQ